jgi:hypothetical protein
LVNGYTTLPPGREGEMIRLITWVLLLIPFIYGPFVHAVIHDCRNKIIDSTRNAIQILSALIPSEMDPEAIHCISSAIYYFIDNRSAAAIPQVIRYLSFPREVTKEEKKSYLLQISIVGSAYPAIVTPVA